MKAIFEVEISASRNKDKILMRIMNRMSDAAMKDKQTKEVHVRLIETEDDD